MTASSHKNEKHHSLELRYPPHGFRVLDSFRGVGQERGAAPSSSPLRCRFEAVGFEYFRHSRIVAHNCFQPTCLASLSNRNVSEMEVID